MAVQGSSIHWLRRLHIALVALLSLPILVACGGGGEPPATATSEAVVSPTAAAAAPTAASPVTAATPPAAASAGEAAAPSATMPSGAVELVAAGEGVYMQNCVACHQPDGRGLPNVFPPMVGSEWVTGDPEILLRIILNGQQGPVDVAGVTYEGAMPPWATLSDEDIAAVASYIRQLDENEAGAVTPDQVATVRAATADRTTPWTAEELQALEVGPTS